MFAKFKKEFMLNMQPSAANTTEKENDNKTDYFE